MAFLRFGPEFDPVSSLLNLQRELDRVFENPLGVDFGLSGRGVFPPVNVFSDNDGYVIRMEVPGVAPDQITIEAHGRTLSVSGRRALNTPGNGSFHRRERSEGNFSRSLQLPSDLDPGKAEALCKYGLLTIRIPKREAAKPRQITVQTA
ncbi:MAG: Hsp20/alpha crystallin family protein [Deltaproteobacteria bacterium]|nr:Hsp20/alpha crystallin family protein [Deltaproteobacteria bacterium]